MKQSSCVCLWCAAVVISERRTVCHRIKCRMYKANTLSAEDVEQDAEDFEEIKVFYAKISNE